MQHMSNHSVQLRMMREAPVATVSNQESRKKKMNILNFGKWMTGGIDGNIFFLPVMAEHKDSPEHGPLGQPIEWPHHPTVQEHRHGDKPDDGDSVPRYVAHRPPWILHPAMGWYGCPDLPQPEWWWVRRIEVFFLLFSRRHLFGLGQAPAPAPAIEEGGFGEREATPKPHHLLRHGLWGMGLGEALWCIYGLRLRTYSGVFQSYSGLRVSAGGTVWL